MFQVPHGNDSETEAGQACNISNLVNSSGKEPIAPDRVGLKEQMQNMVEIGTEHAGKVRPAVDVGTFLFCATDCYFDEHDDCLFDYRKTTRNVITKVNPVVKVEVIVEPLTMP